MGITCSEVVSQVFVLLLWHWPYSQVPTYGEPRSTLRSRASQGHSAGTTAEDHGGEEVRTGHSSSWRRILLLIIAITIHNIPGDYSVCFESECEVV